jgi:glutamyl-tRNA reductase
MLSALFRGAIRAGRRARAETSISASPAAFVAAGLDLAERALGPFRGRPAVVVGAGGMASLAAAELRHLGLGPIRVVSRNLDRARRLAATVEAESGGLDRLAHAIAGADLVVSSTGAAQAVIGRRLVEEAIQLREDRRSDLFLLDLAVPRDVDPSVAELPGVAVADLDHVKDEVLLRRPAEPAEEVEAARAIVSQEVDRFEAWRRAARLAPLIQALRDRGERALAAEVARLGPRLSALSDRDREAAVALARGVVAKLLHDPIVKL